MTSPGSHLPRFTILGSGSSGNSALLETGTSRILIDAGFSARRTAQLLAPLGVSWNDLHAVFLTHEHGDHTAALSGLAKFTHLVLFANAATARLLQPTTPPALRWQLFNTGQRFTFRDLTIDAFSVPHDAQDPVGFVFSFGHLDDLFQPRRRVAWLTDLGHAPAHIPTRIQDVDILAVEANYCPDLLTRDTKRPWSVRQRIAGRHGHLSNHATRSLLDSIPTPAWRHLFLTHLSRDCNSLAAVQAAFASARLPAGCLLHVAPPGEGCPSCLL